MRTLSVALALLGISVTSALAADCSELRGDKAIQECVAEEAAEDDTGVFIWVAAGAVAVFLGGAAAVFFHRRGARRERRRSRTEDEAWDELLKGEGSV